MGFATQSRRAWAADRVKEIAIQAVLLLLALGPLYWLARHYPHGWAWAAALGAVGLVFVLGFLAPVVLEPVFNKFRPLEDATLSERLLALAVRAGAPVREILVADASRRTTKVNAYVSGLGTPGGSSSGTRCSRRRRTRWRWCWRTSWATRIRRHVAVLTALTMAGAAAFVVVLRLLRPHPVPHDTAFILLLGLVLGLAAKPVLSALLRRFERSADRFSLEPYERLRAAYRALHHDLALANLSDLRPPKWLYYWFFSHPTPPERLSDA